MSIVSSSFLFLFLPLSVLIYHLIPAGKNLFYRNLFLVLVSLFFYAWGEPYYVFLLLFLMLFVHVAGKLIDGKRNTIFGKIIVFVTVLLGVGVITYFRNPNYYLAFIGKLIHHNFSLREAGAPLGMSFFVFFPFHMLLIFTGGNAALPKASYIQPCICQLFSK